MTYGHLGVLGGGGRGLVVGVSLMSGRGVVVGVSLLWPARRGLVGGGRLLLLGVL